MMTEIKQQNMSTDSFLKKLTKISITSIPESMNFYDFKTNIFSEYPSNYFMQIYVTDKSDSNKKLFTCFANYTNNMDNVIDMIKLNLNHHLKNVTSKHLNDYEYYVFIGVLNGG